MSVVSSRSAQAVVIIALLPVAAYAMAGYLLRAQSPGGELSPTGRRWQRGFTLVLAAWCAGLLVSMLGKTAPLAVTVPLWALLAYGAILGVRWLWRDWKKERQARDAYFQKLAEEGKTDSPSALTGANKAWRWGLNTYAVLLILALAYGLIRYRGTVGMVTGAVLVLALAYGLFRRYRLARR